MIKSYFTIDNWILSIFDYVPYIKLCWHIILNNNKSYFQQYIDIGRVDGWKYTRGSKMIYMTYVMRLMRPTQQQKH